MTRFAIVVAGLALATAPVRARSAVAPAPDENTPTRVACIGDSITFGAGTKNPRTDSYPAQLGRMLGNHFVVTNFGVSGTTML